MRDSADDKQKTTRRRQVRDHNKNKWCRITQTLLKKIQLEHAYMFEFWLHISSQPWWNESQSTFPALGEKIISIDWSTSTSHPQCTLILLTFKTLKLPFMDTSNRKAYKVLKFYRQKASESFNYSKKNHKLTNLLELSFRDVFAFPKTSSI